MATLPGLTITAPADAGEGSAGGSNQFRFIVNKIINVAPACSVGWRVGGDVDSGDFVAGQELSGRLTIPAGSSQGFIDLLVAADAKVEPNENLTLELFDPTGCLLLKQPAHGTVTVTDLYQVTYTPNAGFTGTDTFDYLVKNSDGQIASSTVEVSVTEATTTPAFPNGFEKKIEAFVGPDSEAMTGFELLFSITDPWLRTQANGGVVRSNTGQDIRLEDGATPPNAIPYARLRYNPGTGQVVGIAKRNRGTGSTWNNIELYAGKQGMVVEEANPSAALSALLACWRLDNGQDISGNARNLTVTTGMPTGQVLFEGPAGDFDRTKAQSAQLANPSSWLNGLAAFTLAMDLQVDQITSDSGVFRTGATVNDAENLCTMAVRPESTAFYAAGVTNMFFAFVKIGATDCRIEGSTNSVRTGVPTTLALTWASGQAITQVVDDAVITNAYANPATPTGTLTVPDTTAGKPLAIAAGPRGSFDGKVGLVRLAATRRSNAWLKAEQRNRLYPKAMLAWAEAVSPNDAAACVAFPGTASASGTDLTLSPLASTPAASGTGLRIISASAEQGTVSLISATPVTQLLYKQKSGFVGVDHISYTIQDAAGRKSSSLITVTVSGTALLLRPDNAGETTGVTPITGIPVQANDEGVGRHITGVTADPAHAVVTIVGTGDTATLTYTPVKPFFGNDQFRYTVADSASATAETTVDAIVRRPLCEAHDDAASVTAGNTAGVVISPLGNDTGVDLFLNANQGTPSVGSVQRVNNNTQLKYTPPTSIPATPSDKFGVNLSGGEFSYPNSSQVKATVPATFNTDYSYPLTTWDYWKGKTSGNIRLPFRLENLERTVGALDATEVGRITAALDAAQAAGCKVLLDMHNYCRRYAPGTNVTPEIIGASGASYTGAMLATAWGLIANQFKSHPAILAWGLMNEPHDLPATNHWSTIAQLVINSINAVDTSHPISVSRDQWSSAHTWTGATASSLLSLTSSGAPLIFEAHMYYDDNHGGDYGAPIADEFPPSGTINYDRGVDRLTVFLNWCTTNNKTGWIGETGAPAGDWDELVTRAMRFAWQNNLRTFTWAGGLRWSAGYPLNVQPTGTAPNYTDDPGMAPYLALGGGNLLVPFQYEAQDAYGSTSRATVTVTVSPSTTPPVLPVANADSYPAVTAGTGTATLSPSPLANDTPGGVDGSLTIQALPGSGAGSAGGTFARVNTPATNKGISYTPPASVTASINNTITYTVSDTATPPNSASALITVPVNPVAPPPPSGPRPESPLLPASNAKIITVGFAGPSGSRRASPDTLAGAYAMASGGDHIQLAPGSYTGTLTFNRDFPTANPVVIRTNPAHGTPVGGAVFSGKVANAAGSSHWFHEVKFTYQGDSDDDCSIEAGQWLHITRCWFTGRSGIRCLANVGTNYPFTNFWVGYNRFTGSTAGAAHTHSYIKFMKETNHPATVNMQFSDIYVYRNYFCDPGATSKHYCVYIGDSHVEDGIYPGQTNKNDQPRFHPFIIEENFVSAANKRPRFAYLKNGVTGVYRNNLVGGMVTPMAQRHGRGTQWWGNRCSGNWEMGGGGTAALFTDLRRNTGGKYSLTWGSAVDSDNLPDFQACDYYLLYGNTGTVSIGTGGGHILDDQGGKINDVRVFQHTGTVSIIEGACLSKTFTINVGGNPQNIPDPPNVAGVTDANGKVLTTWDGDNTGLKTGNQDP